MTKKILMLAVCVCGTLLGGAKCSRDHVNSVEMMNKCVEYQRRKLYPQAIRDCNKAVSLDPENEKAQHNLAMVYMETKDYDQAAHHLQKAISLNATIAIYHYQLGEVYQWLGQYEQSESALKKAIEIEPSLYKAHYRLGRVYEEMDEPQQAMQKYTDTLQQNSRFFDAYRELAGVYHDYGFLPQAEQVLRQGLLGLEGRGEELAVIHHRLGIILEEKKDYENAVKEFRAALELIPALEDAIFSLGWTYSHFDVEKARIWLEKFVQNANQKTRPDYVMAAQARLNEIASGTPVQ